MGYEFQVVLVLQASHFWCRSSLQGIQFICYLSKILLQVVLYNYETRFLTLREEHKIHAFEDMKVSQPKKDEWKF
jgi:hypothetical protein